MTHRPFQVKRRAFSLIEILMVVGILVVILALMLPLYHQYQMRNDLAITTQQTVQALSRARILSQVAQRDSGWGFYAPSGTLYKGASYATRDASADEVFAVPSTIVVSGVQDIAYSKSKGLPAVTGIVTLTVAADPTEFVQIQVQSQTVTILKADRITICHLPFTSFKKTLVVTEAQWPGYQAQGDTLGACAG